MAGVNPSRAAAAMLALLASQPMSTGVGAGSVGVPACAPEAGPTRTVVAVPDAATLRLDDGKELRLTGILAPHAPAGGFDGWPPEREARAALERLVLGRDVVVAQAAARPDRYGRSSAQVFLAPGGEPTWVQGELVGQGHARVHALPGHYACVEELLAREREARAERRGLWASAAYDVVSPYAFKRLWRLRGSYQIVQGRVSVVEEKHGELVLTLTARTRLSFHVRVPLGAGRRQQTARLKTLLHRRIETRGWIEWRHGPALTTADAGLIQAVATDRR